MSAILGEHVTVMGLPTWKEAKHQFECAYWPAVMKTAMVVSMMFALNLTRY